MTPTLDRRLRRRTAPAARFLPAALLGAFVLSAPRPAVAAPQPEAATLALRLADARRYAAAESVLALAPPPPDSGAALDPAALALERARLAARAFAPGACDRTWAWRAARVTDALECAGASPAECAEAWVARARVELRLGRYALAVIAATAADRHADRVRGARGALAHLRAALARAEARLADDPPAAAPVLVTADSLARAAGPAARADLPRLARLQGTHAFLAGQHERAARALRAAVAAADSLAPPDDGEAVLALTTLAQAEGFFDGGRAETDRAAARRRAETALGLDDERALPAIGRTVPNLRDPAQLAVVAGLLERAQARLRARGLADAALAWDADYWLSRARIALRRYDESHELLEHAIAVARRWHGPNSLREMTATLDLGIVEWLSRDTVAALPRFRRALEIGAAHPPSVVNDPNVARHYLAAWAASQGRLADAREENRLRWESYRDRYGETYRSASAPAFFAARCSRGLGDTLAAETWYRRALAPFASGEVGSPEEIAEIRASYALFLYWRGQPERAFPLVLESAKLRRRVIDEAVPWLPERDGLQFADLRRQEHETLLSLALREPGLSADQRAAAWTEMAFGRGLLLEALLRRARHDLDASAEVARLRRELAAGVLASLRAPDTRAARARLDSLRAEIVRLELAPGAAAAAAEPALTPADARRRIGGGALVSFVRAPIYEKAGALGDAVWFPHPRYLAFVLAPGDTVPRVVDVGAADSVDAAVRAWRAAAFASPPARDAAAAGEALRRLVWDPLHAGLPDSGGVWLVPDGELQKVNFYALPLGGGRFVADLPLVLHRLGSERDLLPAAAPSAPAHGLLACGGIDYEAAARADSTAPRPAALPGCRGFLDERFTPLPASGTEAATVARLVRTLSGAGPARDGEPETLTGAAADEAAFKRLAPGRRVIHLATHSYALGPECATGANAALVAQNPLVFSGIALAGANRWREARERRAAEDGLLTAEELAGLDLRGTEWLVLSGCESGLGQVQSWEGVFGLPRAGRRAGVRALVVSLAPVDDDAGAMWMRALYEARFARGEDTARAVRSASRRVLDWLRRAGRAPEPRLWAAFVALGE